MIELLHWSNDPAGDQRALRFFAQHPKGARSAGRNSVPVLIGVDPAQPRQVQHFVVVTGDGVTRWCSDGKHWTFDGRRFAAEVCTDVCRADPCSFPGCGKPTAYLPHPAGAGAGWRHLFDKDEAPTHVGYPMARG